MLHDATSITSRCLSANMPCRSVGWPIRLSLFLRDWFSTCDINKYYSVAGVQKSKPKLLSLCLLPVSVLVHAELCKPHGSIWLEDCKRRRIFLHAVATAIWMWPLGQDCREHRQRTSKPPDTFLYCKCVHVGALLAYSPHHHRAPMTGARSSTTQQSTSSSKLTLAPMWTSGWAFFRRP